LTWAPGEAAPEAPGLQPGAGELHLGDYLAVLRRRWRLIAVAVLVSLAAGFAHYLMTPKMYRATSMVKIDRRVSSLGGSFDAPWLENFWNLEFYPTQYKLLESRGLAERVVENLKLYEDPAFDPPPRDADGVAAAPAALDRARLGALGQRLQAGLEVVPIKSTSLVAISYRSVNPELAARIVNGVAEAFIDWGIETRSQSADKASSFLGQQVEALKAEIQDKEATLQAYGRRSDIVALEPESNPTLQQLQALNRDYVQAMSSRIDRQARYNEVMTAPRETIADSLSGGLVSQRRQDLLGLEQEYATRLTRYKPDMPAMVELRGTVEESRRKLEELIDEKADQARRAAQAEYQTALRREQALKAEFDRAKEETIQMGSAAVEYNNLQMEISTRRQLLDELLQRQSETEVTSRLQATRESNVMVVDRALVPGGPFSPSLRKDLGLALALGLFLGVGCVVLLEYLDRTVKTAEQAERLLGLPVLAVIPDIGDGTARYGYGYAYGGSPGKRRAVGARWAERRRKGMADEDRLKAVELIPNLRPRHAVSEAYRSLRTALLLSSAEKLQVVALTSAQSGEGKTATTANLAVVMAQLGRRVLLIDADLRKPRVHKVFGLTNRRGLVHLLTEGAALDDVVQPTAVAGLEVVTAGAVPPNPSELLASDRMQELLTHAARHYDLVLVDTPPVLAVTDASIVGGMADGLIFCLHSGRVLRDEATASCDRLRLGGVRILGIVLNRFVPAKGGPSAQYYARHYLAYGEGEADGEGATSSSGSAA
jgi:polysaccharide biosynthesis transport protein